MLAVLLPLLLLMQVLLSTALAIILRDDNDCEAFDSDFPAGSMADSDASNVHFIAISPKGSFTTGNGAVELRHQKPDGDVTAKDGINDKVGMAATINVTKPMSHGKVTFVAETPKVAGIVSAMLLIGSDSQDEIDTEILGGDVDHWQTNFFVTPPGSEPIFGTLMAMMTPTPPVPIRTSLTRMRTGYLGP